MISLPMTSLLENKASAFCACAAALSSASLQRAKCISEPKEANRKHHSLYNEELFLLFPAFYQGSAAIIVTQRVITSEWILPPAGAALWSAQSNYGSG